MVKVLFVCLGNICRSPTAEGVFRHHANNAGIKDGFTHDMFIDSAGTAGFHLAAPPDKRAQLTALKFGVDIGDLKARKLAQEDYADFDYILAMDSENLKYMQRKCPENHLLKLHLFMSFAQTSPGVSEALTWMVLEYFLDISSNALLRTYEPVPKGPEITLTLTGSAAPAVTTAVTNKKVNTVKPMLIFFIISSSFVMVLC